jgi:gamma-D-glutamyl-L-lysine dipeptidyl-peptidase
MEYAIVSVPAAPVRRKPNHRKEMVNQLLFGETVKVLKTKGDLWVKIRSLHDGYEGWMTNTMLEEADEIIANMKPGYTVAEMMGIICTEDENIAVPVGSSLPLYNNGKGKLGNEGYSYAGSANNRYGKLAAADTIKQLAIAWLNAPYLWGGRTPLGVDCSGFVQVIYKQLGFDLPRDASQQAKKGKKVIFFSEVRCGDLAFFGNEKTITHVGILLGDGNVIHASGKVRVDGIDTKGIINAETGKRMMSLKKIRRVV